MYLRSLLACLLKLRGEFSELSRSQIAEDHPIGRELWSICCVRNISEDAEVALFPLRAKDFHISLKATDMNIWHEDLGVFACFSFTFASEIEQNSSRSPLNVLFALWNTSMFQEKKGTQKTKQQEET